MISILFAAVGLFAILLLWKRQRPAFIASFIILYSLAYRIIDITYLDLFGPLYAIELDRHVGGNGAAPMFVFASLCFIIPVGLIANKKRILAGIEAPVQSSPYLDGLQRGALIALGALIAFLYLNMLWIGTIPLFVGMDRLDYNPISGLLHNRAYQLNFLLSGTLGIFTVLPRLRGGRFSLSFIVLFMSLLLYWALTGNRFSALLVTCTYYALPFAAVVAMYQKGVLRARNADDPLSALFSLKVIAPVAAMVASVSLIGLVVNSYYSVRNYSDPVYHITQRVLVQPVQTWATTWQRTSADDLGLNNAVISYVFSDLAQLDGNPTVRYLMEIELGYFRANELLNVGHQYAGGYPEIFFELFGFWAPLPLMILLGCGAGYLCFFTIRSLCRGMVLSAFMAIYLSYGFMIAYLGGMISFVLAPSYLIKLVVLIIFIIGERNILSRKSPHAGRLSLPETTFPVRHYVQR